MIAIINNSRITFLDLSLIAAGSFLGYQAHFSGLFLPLMFIGTQILFKKINFKSILAALLGLVLSLLPTFIFDLRHDWLNTRGLMDFLSSDNTVTTNVSFINKFIRSLRITTNNLGGLFGFHLNKETVLFIGILILTVVIYKTLLNKNKKSLNVSLVWLLVTVIIMSFYSHNPPEYYFFIHLPALVLISSQLITDLINSISFNLIKAVILVAILATYIYLNIDTIANRSYLSLGEQFQITQDIKTYAQKNPINFIAYDFKPDIDQIGLTFLLENKINFQDTGSIIHITKSDSNDDYGIFGVWVDPRTNKEASYLTTSEFIIQTPTNMNLYQDYELAHQYSVDLAFRLFESNKYTDVNLLILKKVDDPLNPRINTYRNLKNDIGGSLVSQKWSRVKNQLFSGYGLKRKNFIAIILPQNTELKMLELVEEIKVYDVKPSVL